MIDDAPDIHTLSGAYVLDALEPAQRRAFERHLDSCEPCREEIRSFGEAVSAMADEVATPAPPRLRESVLGAIADVRPLPPQVAADTGDGPTTDAADVVPIEHSPRWRSATTWLAVAAVVLGIVMIGGVWRSVALQGQVTELTAAGAELTALLTAPDATTVVGTTGDGGRASVVVSRSRDAAMLVMEDMAPAPAGHTYQLWYVHADGEAAPAGFAPPGSSGTAMLVGSPRDAVAVGVTVEPEGGSAQPTTEPILALPLPATT